MIEIIKKYFPELSDKQLEQLSTMSKLYPEWNDKINVISRKDIDNLEVHHLLHSLAIAKYLRFASGSKVLDLGCGGGLPGLPLAVMFPEVQFHLIDRVGKKIKVAREIAEACGLTNVTFQHGDSGECHDEFDFVVSRAVMPQADLYRLVKNNFKKKGTNAIPNGLITLKGGELTEELKGLPKGEEIELSRWFEEPFFKTKKLIYTPKI